MHLQILCVHKKTVITNNKLKCGKVKTVFHADDIYRLQLVLSHR